MEIERGGGRRAKTVDRSWGCYACVRRYVRTCRERAREYRNFEMWVARLWLIAAVEGR